MATIQDLLMDAWVQAFMEQHNYRPPWISQDEWGSAWDLSPEDKIGSMGFDKYEWGDQQRALQYGQNVANATGRAPTDDEYRWQWFADRGINADTGLPMWWRKPGTGSATTPFGINPSVWANNRRGW